MDFRWYRQSLPRREILIIAAVCLLAFDLALWLIFLFGRQVTDPEMLLIIFRPILPCIAVTSAVLPCGLALFRLARFPDPPTSNYAKWLAQTPWTSDQRTPFGPWHPVQEDVLMISVLSVIAMLRGSLLFLLPGIPSGFGIAAWQIVLLLGFSQPMLFVLCWAFCGFAAVARRWDWSNYVALMVIGIIGHLFLLLPTVAMAATALVLIALPFIVYRRMSFELATLQQDMLCDPEPDPPKRAPVYEVLSPEAQSGWMQKFLDRYRPRAFAIGFLCLILFTTVPGQALTPLVAPFVLMAPLVRVAVVKSRYNSHLGLLARYRLKRWIVPDHDRIWLPVLWSVVALVACIPIVLVSLLCRWPYGFAPALMISAVVTICLRTGPDMRSWTLTAPVSISIRGPQEANTRIKSKQQ
ncbi:MAG: hypothetical protein Fues2KO_33990 [Fuerstiella sp.]